MLFVVVYLVEPKKRIILPENFIYDLCEVSLKNNGRNSNHKYLIYWSKNAIGDGSFAPDFKIEPNFDAPLSHIYPPENDVIEACYIAQIKLFVGKKTNNTF